MVSKERQALQRLRGFNIVECENDQNVNEDLNILEGCVNASEILRIIFNAPFILEQLFNLGKLGDDATHRYMWGTISAEDVEKVKEFF